jgi:hypothetical protein
VRQPGKIRAEDVERLRHELENVPAPRDEERSKKQAIEKLAPQLRDLLTKGHNVRSLAEVLSQRGLAITPILLASYLRGHARRETHSRGPERAFGRRREGAPSLRREMRSDVKRTPRQKTPGIPRRRWPALLRRSPSLWRLLAPMLRLQA